MGNLMEGLIFKLAVAAALVALALILLLSILKRRLYIPQLRLSRRGKWVIAAIFLVSFVYPLLKAYVMHR
jgi:hypothetical protein